jgi:hypothetical protein
MRWLAGRGVGAIALGNSTYAPMGVLTMQMLDTLHAHGEVPAAPEVEAPGWENAAHRLVALINSWSDADANALFADNVALDESFDRRRADAQRAIQAHGPLRITGLRPTSSTNGTIDVEGSGAPLTIAMEQSPLPGGPVQFYEIEG